jgi:hypothetical protein
MPYITSYSTKVYLELKVFQGCSILTLHVFPSQNMILKRGCHTLRSRCVCVWKYLVANLNSTLLLEQVFLLETNEKLLT